MGKKGITLIVILIVLLLAGPQIYKAVNKQVNKPKENKKEEPVAQVEKVDSLELEALNASLHDKEKDVCTVANTTNSELDGESVARIEMKCQDYTYSAMTSLTSKEEAKKNYRDDYLVQKYAENFKELNQEIMNGFNEKYQTNIIPISISGEDYYFDSDEKAEVLKSIDSWKKALEVMKSETGKGEITLQFSFNISDDDLKTLGGKSEVVSKFESYIKTEFPGITPVLYQE